MNVQIKCVVLQNGRWMRVYYSDDEVWSLVFLAGVVDVQGTYGGDTFEDMMEEVNFFENTTIAFPDDED